ncbi:hypothetical protein N0V93_002307 [Gnomoniopsis smithogilvyi]|uniref:Uncharacterized protein n=1 Tax=Gnomoniopsis smithogilvyi TaxID=1191159 RepID=A0A9W9CXJ7_9PEZI|nr:hypothetical protein N0V93_002307 [Gnomoniopsis smithogilvyi]
MAYTTMVPSSAFLIFLALLSTLSFVPQLLRLTSRGDNSGISLTYVLLCLISATQQLTLGGIYTAFAKKSALFAWLWPLSMTDWVNLAQLLIVWVGMFVLFIACLSTTPNAPVAKCFAILIYLSVLMITLVPLVIILVDYARRRDADNSSGFSAQEMFLFGLIRFLVPIVTFLAVVAFYPEARAILSRPPNDMGSLSLAGLAVQALVFAAVAVSWVYRVKWPEPSAVPVQETFGWYRLVGWAAVNNAIFAATQALLFWLAYTRTEAPSSRSGETNPLLGGL